MQQEAGIRSGVDDAGGGNAEVGDGGGFCDDVMAGVFPGAPFTHVTIEFHKCLKLIWAAFLCRTVTLQRFPPRSPHLFILSWSTKVYSLFDLARRSHFTPLLIPSLPLT